MPGATSPSMRWRQRDSDERRRQRDGKPTPTRRKTPTTTTPTPQPATSSAPTRPRVRFAPPVEAPLLSRIASKTGFLKKQADNEPGKWTKYYFVLKPTTYLYYYNSKHDSEPRGIIDVDLLQDIRLESDCQQQSVGGGAHCFRVTGYLPHELGGNKGAQKTKFRPLYLDPESRDDARAWMEAIKHHRFDLQRERDHETLLKTMVVVDRRAEMLQDQAKELAAVAHTIVQRGEQSMAMLRGGATADSLKTNKNRRRGLPNREGEDTMEALRRIEELLRELYEEAEQRKHQNEVLQRQEEERKKEDAVVRQRVAEKQERDRDVESYRHRIEKLHHELELQAIERDRVIDQYETRCEQLHRELELQAEERDRVLDQYETRCIDLQEREQELELHEDAWAKRLDQLEIEYYQRMREINRDAQRRAKERDEEMEQVRNELVRKLEQTKYDPATLDEVVQELKVGGAVAKSTLAARRLARTPRVLKSYDHIASNDYRWGKPPSSPSSVAGSQRTGRTSSTCTNETDVSSSPQDDADASQANGHMSKDWVYHESPIHPGLFYSFNKKTGETRWDHPSVSANTRDPQTAIRGRDGRAQTADPARNDIPTVRRSTMPLQRPKGFGVGGARMVSGTVTPGITTTEYYDEEDNQDDEGEDLATPEQVKKSRMWNATLPSFRGRSKATSATTNGVNPAETPGDEEGGSVIATAAATTKKSGWFTKKLPNTPFGRRKERVSAPRSDEQLFEEQHEERRCEF